MNYKKTLLGTFLLIAAFFMQSFLLKESKLIREPYLQAVWADSAAVMFKTKATVQKAVLQYGENQKKLKNKVNTTGFSHEGGIVFEAVIKELKPDTKYYYSVEVDGALVAKGKDYYFVSAPKKQRKFTFYAMGDIGAPENRGGSYAGISAKQIDKLKRRPDFGLGLGDIVYPKGESKMYDANLFKPLENVFKNIPFYPCLGNHDWYVGKEKKNYEVSIVDRNFGKEFKLPNNEHYYGFEYLNTYFIALDSRNGDFYDIDNQTAWLKKRLETIKGSYDWIVVYLHHNGKTCSYKSDYKHVINLYSVFAQGGVDLVLNGHAHTYERLKPYDANGNVIEAIKEHKVYKEINNGFISITTGAGGKLKTPWKPEPSNTDNCADGNIVAAYGHVPHFSLFEIDGKKLKMKAISSLDGSVFDEFSISK